MDSNGKIGLVVENARTQAMSSSLVSSVLWMVWLFEVVRRSRSRSWSLRGDLGEAYLFTSGIFRSLASVYDFIGSWALWFAES